ncbi:MAG: hypothetical protein LUI10_07580 [Lachnospiraceae bacterium]|nr:hypothetical protein [Lachnospiraceae bacterium]
MANGFGGSPYIPDVHFELIPIKNLVSNQDYQRKINNAHVGRTANNFDIYQINPVKVSRRDGTNYVFDGQHTVETVAEASGSRETPVWCMIYDDLIYEQEADIFANQKKFTRPLKSIEIFNANIEAGNDVQMTIKQLVESYNLVISAKRIPGNISAVNALEYIFDKFGYQVLDRTLLLAVSTWEGEVDSLSSNMLKGIAKLVVAYGDKLNDEQFADRLGKVSVREIIRTAKDRHAGTQGYAEAMLLQYNKRLKYPLRWNALTSRKQAASSDRQETPAADIAQLSLEHSIFVDPATGEVIETATDEDENDGDEDGIIPDEEGALPNQTLMDNLSLRTRG